MSETPATPLSDQARAVLQALQRMLTEMNFPASVDVSETDDQIALTITSDQPLGLLIGKGGQTLNAIELLVTLIARHQLQTYGKRVVVDAEGYRQRQVGRLEEMAREAAHRALDTGECVPLEPMNARDRRTVHMVTTEIEGIESTSLGEEPYRYIVLCPSGKKPPELEA